ncbi:Rho GTPase activation protein [Rickenella mellea]|uniref:Rho GTPase activation protein n=1 Tax=Rickenella mellea TaxID=50990 RepID=A0A4Y7QFT2_9AGAM|nr:Rho GTPase activation protein [Rickenella mellea]
MPVPTRDPPTKASLKAWWRQFTAGQKDKKAEQEHAEKSAYPHSCLRRCFCSAHPVFGVPLRESLHYASVQISTANADGELYVWGYIPVVVAKCGLYLKENATEVEGTFRISGSTKRMRDLQAVFERPPKYGKNLEWKAENYTTHDVASVFRRYLTQMPEPVIPHDLYDKVSPGRCVALPHSNQIAQFREALSKKRPTEEVIKTYKQLIRSMPRGNQYLLLYVLDLLSVFARKSDKNRMTATNLAVIFRPGLISHPDHEMSPKEHELSQRVLEFLIAHQDWFMLDIPPPPTSRQNSTVMSSPIPADDDDVHVMPSSEDEERSSAGSSGWKLVERGKKIGRRRTLSDHVASTSTSAGAATEAVQKAASVTILSPLKPSAGIGGKMERGELSPVAEQPPEGSLVRGASVTRSRTMPTRRKDSKDSDREERPQNVLKKQKRQSSGPPRRESTKADPNPTAADTHPS